MMSPPAPISRLLLACIVGGLLVLGIAGSANARSAVEEAHRILSEVREADRLPSISVAVARNGAIVYAHALGRADLENQTGATELSRYPVGSVSKSVTAVAALQLAHAGDLDLEAPIQTYCPAFPEKSAPITTRQLLAHTSGIRHYDYRRFEEDFLNRRHFSSIQDALTKFAEDPLVHPPGTQYHYSSWGYVVLGCVIEGASGSGFADYLQNRIAKPAGMASTRLDVVRDVVPHRARGYASRDDGTIANAGPFDASDRYPAGGILSTPSDLVRFGDALMANQLLAPAYRDLLWSSSTLASGEPTGHGLGWDLSDDGSVSHGGTSIGSTAFLYLRPDSGTAVAIAVNLALWQRDREELAARIADLFEGAPPAGEARPTPGPAEAGDEVDRPGKDGRAHRLN